MELSTSNTTMLPTWDNLNGYMEALIKHSYLGSWTLLRSLQSNPATLQVNIAEPRLQAKVSHIRVLAWFVISLFVPISAFVWYFEAQWASKRSVALDYTIAALLTDVSNVLDHSEAKDLDLTNLSYATRADKRLKLRLSRDNTGKHSLSVQKQKK